MSESGACKKREVAMDFHKVKIDPTAQLSPHCTVVGDVNIGPRCTVFAGTHIRGDAAPVSIGREVNIQEGCVFHVGENAPLVIGDHVTVGHRAVLHGCVIGENSLVGMGAIVMDRAVIGENCLIGAGSLVTQGKTFEPGSLILGSPARVVRMLSENEIATMITRASDWYCEVGSAMVNDGVMLRPSPDATIWPERD